MAKKEHKIDKDYEIIQELLDGKNPEIGNTKDDRLNWWRRNWERFEKEKQKRITEERRKEKERIAKLYVGKALAEQLNIFKKEMVKEGWGERRDLPFYLMEEELEELELEKINENLLERIRQANVKKNAALQKGSVDEKNIVKETEEESLVTEDEKKRLDEIEQKKLKYRTREKIAFRYYSLAFGIFVGLGIVYVLLECQGIGTAALVTSIWNIIFTFGVIIFYLGFHGLFLGYNLRKELVLVEKFLYWNSYKYYIKLNIVIGICLYFTTLLLIIAFLGGFVLEDQIIILQFCVLFNKISTFYIICVIYKCLSKYVKNNKVFKKIKLSENLFKYVFMIFLLALLMLELNVVLDVINFIIIYIYDFLIKEVIGAIQIFKKFVVIMFKLLWVDL